MARQTRQQRRARREAQAETAAAPVPASRPTTRDRDGARRAEALAPEAPRPSAAAPRGRFIAECWAELQKVEWPGQKQVMQGTAVVLIACAIVGAYLWGADLVLKRVVENVLLGQ